jgi:hypothetical protein
MAHAKPRWSYLQQKSYPPNEGSAGRRGNRLNSSAMRARNRDSLRQQCEQIVKWTCDNVAGDDLAERADRLFARFDACS